MDLRLVVAAFLWYIVEKFTVKTFGVWVIEITA